MTFALFTSVSFTAGSLLVALQNLVMYTLLFELPQVLAALLATDAAATGRLLVSMMAAMIVASFAGGAAHRPGRAAAARCRRHPDLPRRGGRVGGGRPVVGAASCRFRWRSWGSGSDWPLRPPRAASLAAVPRRYSGAAAGIGSTMRYLGGVVGVALLGRLVDLGGDRSAVLAEHRTVLVVFAVALLGAVACAVVLPRRTASRGSARVPDDGAAAP